MDGVVRRFGYAPTKYSELFKEAIHALEDTKYTVDDNMMSIALRVLAKSGSDDDEGYVLRGCEKMGSDDAYVSVSSKVIVVVGCIKHHVMARMVKQVTGVVL